MKPEHLLAHEWIGLEVEVIESPNKSEIGLKGEVVDETMNTLKLKTEKSLKILAKNKRVFRVKFGDRLIRVSGNLICFRPEDRIKKGLMLIKKAKGW
jgi:ribonuclease P protein subunit POP4